MPQKPPSEQAKHKADSHKKDLRALHMAALQLAARHGWLDLTLAEIHAAAPAAAPKGAFRDKWHLIADILATLDADMQRDAASRLTGDNWRDDLFELLMTRFDLMQDVRDGYSDIMPAALNRPLHAGPVLSRQLLGSIDNMLSLAAVPVDGLRRHAAVTAFAAIYVSLLEVWRLDTTPDLARTMAALDVRLGWFEKALRALSGRQADDNA